MAKFFCFNLFSKCQRVPPVEDLKEDNWENEYHLVDVIDVYDGDSCTIRVKRNGVWIKQRIRLMGYDTRELKPPKDIPNREKEIELAKQARDAFKGQIKGKIWMHCVGREKFGRILAYFYNQTTFGREEKSINDWMIENGYGKPYSGGTKEKW